MVYIDKLVLLCTICCTMAQVEVKDTDTAEEQDTSALASTSITGFYGTRAEIMLRLQQVELLQHEPVSEAIAAIENEEASGSLDADTLIVPEDFCREVFLRVTQSRAVANEVTRNLVHTTINEFNFLDKGFIFDRFYGEGGMSEILGTWFYGDPITGSYRGVAAVKVANATDVGTQQQRFQGEVRMMSLHSQGPPEKADKGYRTVLPKYHKASGHISLRDPQTDQLETRAYYAMELLKGHSLQEILEEILNDDGLPLDPQIGVDLLVTVLIKLLNFKGDIHRDLKPANLFVLDDGTVRVIDCGISLADSSDANPRLTQTTDNAMGTPYYISPEQLLNGGKGAKPFASDVYSLAASIYHLVIRQLPVQGSSIGDYINAHHNGTEPPFVIQSPDHSGTNGQSMLLDSLHQDLATALRVLLSNKPEDRLVPGANTALLMRVKPGGKADVMELHMTDAQMRVELKRWIDHLLPASSFDEEDIEDGDPSIFASLEVPSDRELDPDLQVGSAWTRREMYDLLTSHTQNTIQQAEQRKASILAIQEEREQEAENLVRQEEAHGQAWHAEAEKLAKQQAAEKLARQKEEALSRRAMLQDFLLQVAGLGLAIGWSSIEESARNTVPGDDQGSINQLDNGVPSGLKEPPIDTETENDLVTDQNPVHISFTIDKDGNNKDIDSVQIMVDGVVHKLSKDEVYRVYTEDPETDGGKVRVFVVEVNTTGSDAPGIMYYGYSFDGGQIILIGDNGSIIGLEKDGSLAHNYDGKNTPDHSFNEWGMPLLRSPVGFHHSGDLPGGMEDQFENTADADQSIRQHFGKLISAVVDSENR